MIFNIDNSKKYGIMMSGGLDSSILFYLLVESNPNIDLQPFTIPKYDGAALYVDNIISYVNQKLKLTIPKTFFVGNPNLHHREQSFIAILEIFRNYKIDHLFNAVNKNPPHLESYPGAPARDKNIKNEKLLVPFINLYKSDILKMLPDQNLVYITHSCTEQKVGRCHLCWQCKERAWAFEELGLEDKGTN